MNMIQNMLFLTPEAVAAHVDGVTVRADDGKLYNVCAARDDEYEITIYSVTRVSDCAVAHTQIFDNVVKYVFGAKPF